MKFGVGISVLHIIDIDYLKKMEKYLNENFVPRWKFPTHVENNFFIGY